MIIPDISLEMELWKQGYAHVAGVDEAGKGPWAGPVTAGAVIIHKQEQIVSSVRDSKKMTKKQREKAFDEICRNSSSYGIGIVSSDEIDAIGINNAVKKAMIIALKEIELKAGLRLSFVIVDGSKTTPLDGYVSKRIKAGGLYHYSISAGSVLAKVTRDRIMRKFAHEYPLYGFDTHVGYGTSGHIATLKQYGPCPIHRKSYAPVKTYLYPTDGVLKGHTPRAFPSKKGHNFF